MGVLERLDRLDDYVERPWRDRWLSRVQLPEPAAQTWDRLDPEQRYAVWLAATSGGQPGPDDDVEVWLAVVDVAEGRLLRTAQALAVVGLVVLAIGLAALATGSRDWLAVVFPSMAFPVGGLAGFVMQMKRLRSRRLQLRPVHTPPLPEMR